LTHDFCAISLSDMLTPWPVIAARLEAAARADLVTVLYNPKSSRRPRQILEARAIFLRHRDPETPVARVHAAYRPRQAVEIVTLDAMTEGEIGMTTTLIVGNASSFVRAGLMVTPRGYHRKYDLADGGVRPGEAPRMPLSSGLDGWQQGLALEAARWEGALDAYERDLRASLTSLAGDVDGQLDAMLVRARVAFLSALGEAAREGSEGKC
jgi:precorrin-3B C17-methyltransferase